MGLADLTPEDTVATEYQQYKRYPSHEWDDKLEQWAEEVTPRFPGGVEYDFIEVSPEMTRTSGFAYKKTENGYIRISEQSIEKYPEYYVKFVLIHELAHLWFYQNGYEEYSDGSGIFEWVLGRVGGDLDEAAPGTDEYEIMWEFFNHQPE